MKALFPTNVVMQALLSSMKEKHNREDSSSKTEVFYWGDNIIHIMRMQRGYDMVYDSRLSPDEQSFNPSPYYKDGWFGTHGTGTFYYVLVDGAIPTDRGLDKISEQLEIRFSRADETHKFLNHISLGRIELKLIQNNWYLIVDYYLNDPTPLTEVHLKNSSVLLADLIVDSIVGEIIPPPDLPF